MRLLTALCGLLLITTQFGCQAEQPTAAEPTTAAAEVEPQPAPEVVEPTPPPLPQPPPQAPAETLYVVQPGDTLWNIAQRIYGDGKLWKAIYEANRDRIPSVSAMKVGTELRIPPRP